MSFVDPDISVTQEKSSLTIKFLVTHFTLAEVNILFSYYVFTLKISFDMHCYCYLYFLLASHHIIHITNPAIEKM
jgi:hypothetical protein